MNADPAAAMPRAPRLVGLDIARAIAMLGMIIVNYTIVMVGVATGSGWLADLERLLQGRAAATFVTLAGIGTALGASAALAAAPGDPIRRVARLRLLRRTLFLTVLGWAFYVVIWPADILHYYGVYLAIGALVLCWPTRWLLALAAGAILLETGFLLVADFGQNWNLETLEYEGIATPSGFLRNLLVDGIHPVFPWIAFFLVGLALGRTDLADPAWRRRLALAAIVVLAFAESVSRLVFGPRVEDLSGGVAGGWRALFSVQPIPPTPFYVFAAGATAILVIVAALWLARVLPPRWAEPFISSGQLALSAYLGHVLIGMVGLAIIGRLEGQTLPFAIAASCGFYVLAILFSWRWRRRHARGPLEALMRRLAP